VNTESSSRTGRRQMSAEFHPYRLLPSVLSGVLNGVLEIALATSFAALIFSGELSPYLARGIGMALFSTTIGAAVVALLSSYRSTISSNQDVPAAIVAIAAAGIAGSVRADAAFPTIAILIASTTAAAGLVFLVLGTFRLTGLVRFLPYPVVGGFLAGTGWLLLTGGVSMMAGRPFAIARLGALLEPAVLVTWLPGAAIGGLLLFLSNRIRHALFLPTVIMVTFALFYVLALARGVSLSELSAGGWLLGPFPSGNLWEPIGANELSRVDWSFIWPQLPNVAAAVGMSAIALLLNATGLELTLRRDLDLNGEMRGVGLANLVSAVGGGFISYHTLSMTTLNSRLGVTSRLGGLITALVTGLGLLFGGAALSIFPKLVFGALLAFLGLSFLWEWLVDARQRLPRVDYLIVLGILVIIAAAGFLQGVAVGVVAAIVMFVVSYSRSSVVKHELDGATFKSRVTRSAAARGLLVAVGDQAYYLQLQGFIFFGTAYSLLEQVRSRVRRTPTRFVVLDFRQVIGLDSTGMLSFNKMRQLAHDHDFTLILAGLPPALREQFDRGGLAEESGVLGFEADFDRAVEWCEDQICGAEIGPGNHRLVDYLQAIVPGEATARLLRYLERREVNASTALMQQGDDPDVLYFVESGQVTAQLEQPGKSPLRLETMRGGRTVGELGFYLGTQRSAAVITDEPSVVYVLTREKMAEIENDDPAAAYAFHRIIVHLLGERVLHLVRAVDALQR